HSRSGDYTLPNQNTSGLTLTFMAHETGHALGLEHSWNANPETEYGNPWDIMSAATVTTTSHSAYPPAGPGVNAPNLDFLGLIPSWATWTNGADEKGADTIRLLPVNQAGLGFLTAKVTKN